MVYSLPWDRLLNSGSCINYGFSWQSQKPPQWFTILGQKLVVIKQFWIGCCWFATWEKQGGVISAHRHLEQRWAKRLPGWTMGTLNLGSQTFPSPQTCVRYSRMHHIHGFKIVLAFTYLTTIQPGAILHPLSPSLPHNAVRPRRHHSRAWEEVWHPRGRHQRAHGQLGQGYAVRVLRSTTEGVGLASWNGHGAWWILVGPQHQLNRYVGHDLIQVVNDMTIPTLGAESIFWHIYIYIYIVCIYVYMYIMCT